MYNGLPVVKRCGFQNSGTSRGFLLRLLKLSKDKKIDDLIQINKKLEQRLADMNNDMRNDGKPANDTVRDLSIRIFEVE